MFESRRMRELEHECKTKVHQHDNLLDFLLVLCEKILLLHFPIEIEISLKFFLNSIKSINSKA